MVRRAETDAETREPAIGRTPRAAGLALFLCLFSAQSGLTALSPLLPQIAAGFGVSTASAGQVRTVTGLVAAAAALLVGLAGRRAGLRRLLYAGLALLGLGSLASAAAPNLYSLALAQAPTGAAVGLLLAAGTAAAGGWADPDRRARMLSVALIGQPGAWILGMPLIGLLAESSWRLALAVPFGASAIAAAVLTRAPSSAPRASKPGGLLAAIRRPRIGSWALGELFAFSAWGGTLVYAGALFVEAYGASLTGAGIVLGLGAAGYMPGNMLAGRFANAHASALLIVLGLAAAAAVAVFASVRVGLWPCAALFAFLCFLAGGRTLAGSAFGLTAAPDLKLAVMGLRAAATHLGYLLGAALGGVALALGGYSALGWTLAALFVAAVMPHALPRATVKAARPARPSRPAGAVAVASRPS